MTRTACTVLLFLVTFASSAPGQEKKDSPVRRDSHGDPLPEGTIARLGTLRFRTGISSPSLMGRPGKIVFLPDNKSMVMGTMIRRAGVGPALDRSSIGVWDMVTGKKIRDLLDFGWFCDLSPDGKVMAVLVNGLPALWDVSSGVKIADLEGSSPARMVFSPDGKVVAGIESRPLFPGKMKNPPRSNTIHRWSVPTGKPLPSFQMEEDVADLVFRGKTLVTGDSKGAIHVLDASSGKELRKWQAAEQEVLLLQCSQDGRVVASCSSDDLICLWDGESGQKLSSVNPTPPPAGGKFGRLASTSVVFALSPDGKMLAAGSGQQRFARQAMPAFELWDVASGTKRSLKTPLPPGLVQDLTFSHDGRVLTCWSGSGVISLWDPVGGTRLNASFGHESSIDQLAAFPDGKHIATLSGNSIRIWDLDSASEQDQIIRADLNVMALSPGGRLLAVLQPFGGFLWDTKSKKTTELPFQGRYGGLAYSPDGKKLALAGLAPRQVGEVAVFDTSTWSQLWTSEPRKGFGGGMLLAGMTDAAFSADGSFVATTGPQHVSLWNAANGKWIRDLGQRAIVGGMKGGMGKMAKGGRGGFAGRLEPIGGFAVSSDGRMVATVINNELSVWETATGQKRGVFTTFEEGAVGGAGAGAFGGRIVAGPGFRLRRGPAAPVAFSPDSRLVAFGQPSGQIEVLDLSTGRTVRHLTGHTDGVTCLTFSRDGRRLFSSSRDTTALVWDFTGLSQGVGPDDWQALAGDDARAAYQAIGQLAATPATTLPELKKRLDGFTEAPVAIRAFELLERIGTPDARQILDEYARNGKVETFRPEAGASSERLRRRAKNGQVTTHLLESLRHAATPLPKDRDGNVLPEGAVARLGSTRFRFVGRGAFSGEMVAFLDDKTLAISGRAEPVQFVDLASGNRKPWFVAEVNSAGARLASAPGFAVSADGKTLAAGSVLWDVASRKQIGELPRRPQIQKPVACSPDGKTLVLEAGPLAGKVSLWSVGSDEARPLEGSDGNQMGFRRVLRSPQRFAFSRDGKHLAGVVSAGQIGIWDAATAKSLREWTVPDFDTSPGGGEISVLGFAAGSDILVTLVEDTQATPTKLVVSGKVILWDPRSGKQVRQLNDEKTVVRSATLSLDGRMLATSSPAGIALWELPSGKLIREITCSFPGALAFSRDGQRLASVGVVIRLWDVKTGKLLTPEQGHQGSIDHIALSADGTTLASTGGGTIIVWDADGRERRRFGPGFSRAALAPDFNVLALVDDGLHLRDVATGKELPGLPGEFANIRRLMLSPQGQVLLIQDDVAWSFWDLTSRTLLWKMEGDPWPLGKPGPFRSATVRSVAFSPDGRHIAVLDQEVGGPMTRRQVHFREVTTGKKVRSFGGITGLAASMDFSADGRSLMVRSFFSPASGGAPLVILETATGKERVRSLRNAVGVHAVSPDGRFLALSDSFDSIEVLELPAGTIVRRFQADSRITALTFSADGRLLFSGGGDTTILVWNVAPETGKPSKPRDNWAILSGDDAASAYRAMWKLVRSPAQSVTYLRQELARRHVGIPPEAAKLINDLDSDSFKAREQASAAIVKLGASAELALEQALPHVRSLESRRRIQRLLEKMDAGKDFSAEQAALLRCFEVLERIGTSEARQILDSFARQGNGARLRRAAQAAAERMGQNGKSDAGGTGSVSKVGPRETLTPLSVSP
jgi:WD40 repeat protein